MYPCNTHMTVAIGMRIANGLAVQVRDHALSIKDNLPQSDVNKEYFLQNMDKQVSLSTCIICPITVPSHLHVQCILYLIEE